MKILLINPPIRTDKPASSFPVGLGYIAAVLKENGHEVEVLDIQAYRYSKEVVEDKISKSDADIFGIGGHITVYNFLKDISFLIKKYHPEKKLIAGGFLSSAPETILNKTKTDIIVHNEGEVTVCELMDKLQKDESFEGVLGISFKKDGRIVKNPPRPEIKSLDELPFPAYELFPMEAYLNALRPGLGHVKSMDIITTRGCPYNCTFCYRGSRIYRIRSAEKIVSQIKFLKEKYGIKAINFDDENFLVSKRRVMELCDRIINEKLDVRFSCYGRVDNVDKETLERLKKAGCVRLGFGIESGSQRMLDAINKRYTVEQAKRAIMLARKARIPITMTFMIGNEGEDEQTVKETIDFCKELSITLPPMFITTAYPGCEIYNRAKQKGMIQDEEAYISMLGDADELLLNFSNLPDEKLLQLKAKAERETRRNVVKRIFDFYRYYGFEGIGYAFSMKYVNFKYLLKNFSKDELRKFIYN